MINYNEIKEILRAGVWHALGRFFVDLENGDPRPDEQEGIDTFISHKITSPSTDESTVQWNDDDKMIYRSQFQMTVSLTVHSDDKGKALDTAQELRNWFDFQGYEYLKENNLVVVQIHPISDRTTFLETGYDNRVGFDVTIRATYEDERAIEVIERVELNDELIGE